MHSTADNPIQAWLTALGQFLEADLSNVRHGWRLEGHSNSWNRYVENALGSDRLGPPLGTTRSVTVAVAPNNRKQWNGRLALVEKAAAQTLTNAPVAFSAALPERRTRARRPTVVRLAFGLSCALGLRLRKRFTAYFLVNEGRSFLRQSGDELFTLGLTIGPLRRSRKELRSALPQLSAAVVMAHDMYRSEPSVTAEIERLTGLCKQELRCLERLYRARSGQDATLLGLPVDGLKGDDAVESEYANRFEDIVDRFRLRVIFEPLTIGVVDGWTPGTKKSLDSPRR